MVNIHAKINSLFLSVCVLLQRVNSEMLMTDFAPFLLSEVLATDCLGQFLTY